MLQPAPSMARIFATVFMPFAGGYFLSYLFRSVNAVIAPDLARDVGIGANEIGLLTSAYFLSFAAIQIPLGMLIDRYGPRRVQSVLLLFAALGSVLFSRGDSLGSLIAARAFIGLGVAGSLMTSFKAIVLWFPRERWAAINGTFLTMGGIGALSATLPVEWALSLTDWRGVFVILAVLVVLVSITIFLIVPEKAEARREESLAEQLAGVRKVFRDPLFLRIAPIGIGCNATSMAIQGLWAGPYLRDVAGLDRMGVAEALFVLTLFLAIGFLATGLVADRLAAKGIPIMTTMTVGVVFNLITLGVMTIQIDPASLIIVAAFGVLGNMTVLGYPILSQHFPVELAGRANTALNMCVFLGAFVIQYVMGAIIALWPASASGQYPAVAYLWSFGTMLALEALAFVWFFVAPRWLKNPQAA